MCSAGAVQDMINRLKRNEAHRKALQAHRQDLSMTYADTAKSKPHSIQFDISAEDLENLKVKIREDIILERKRARLKFLLASTPILFILGCLLFWVF